jgi:biotin carboxyl carrier protein
MAGRVVAILVQPGRQVKEGDPTAHRRSHEDEHRRHCTPKAGQVAEILTTVGAAVDEGQLLARLQE